MEWRRPHPLTVIQTESAARNQVMDLRGRDQFRGFAIELAELAHTGVVSLFGARADGQELEVIGERF